MQGTSNVLWALSIYRDWADMTQEELAEASGVPKSTIVHLETEPEQAHHNTVTKLAEALGVEPHDLSDYELMRVVGNRPSKS